MIKIERIKKEVDGKLVSDTFGVEVRTTEQPGGLVTLMHGVSPEDMAELRDALNARTDL